MKVKLTKISRPEGLDGGLRTQEVIGETTKLPVVGECFEMFAPPLYAGDIRMVNTSEVMKISVENKTYTLNTRTGSVYTVELLDE